MSKCIITAKTGTVIPCYDNWDKRTLVSTKFDITLDLL